MFRGNGELVVANGGRVFGSGGNSQSGPNGGGDVQSVVQGNSGTESDSEIEVDLNLAYDRIFEQVPNFVRKK